ncbi:MAG: hypothetical protein F6K09_32160 [Merismopedia sp. SIO2A8]|nr:hypothetical protein [Merismopedia sp. SIO2A8]
MGSSWGVSELTICRCVKWVENALIPLQSFHLPGKQALRDGTITVTIMAVTETPIERPRFTLARRENIPLNVN